jgi:hypothetical protein
MIKEYISNFSYLSIAVMVLFFTLFWFLVYQAIRIGRQSSVAFSKLPLESETKMTIESNNGRNSNG